MKKSASCEMLLSCHGQLLECVAVTRRVHCCTDDFAVLLLPVVAAAVLLASMTPTVEW